ncbi:tyrosine-protein phosphatase [Virgibacillus sp. JSM 102003]|uniref:tyrosine-protein phosphatase n=1 Tax=Virgibacillus sp. JSM 102003 TaxID=1562108 RepID=UPI0035C0DC71
MIDIHCHILPGVDDGAETLADSVEMAKAAVDQGIRTIVATPHHRNGKYENTKNEILHYTNNLNEKLVSEGIPLIVLPGQETRINGDIIDGLAKDEIMPINEFKYVFVEFPSEQVPGYAKQLLFDIQVVGYIPIIVHPERNREIIEHPSVLYELIRKGALSQITAGSICGKFGKNLQKFSHQLVEANLTHFIASDAHNTTSRGFCLEEAYHELQKQHGNEALYMYRENCELLISGKTVNRDEAHPVKRKKILGLF